MNIQFSKIILGTAQLGMPYGLGSWKRKLMPEAEAFRILNAAWEKGITTLDTSPEYGLAEERVFRFMKENSTRKFHIISKIKNIPSEKHSAQSFIKDWFTKSPFVDLDNCLSLSVLLHNEADIRRKYVIHLLDELVAKSGLLGWVVSVYEPEFASHACEVDSCSMVQLPFSAMSQTFGRDRIIEKLFGKKKLVVARSIFLQGLLLKPRQYSSGFGREYLELLSELRSYLEENDITFCEFAISMAISEPGVSNVVIGADSQEQVLSWNTSPQHLREFNLPKALLRDLRSYENATIKPHVWRKYSNEAQKTI